MKVVNTLSVYEVDGKDEKLVPPTTLSVESHWNRASLVVIVTPDGMKYTVPASEMLAAIRNAQNAPRG